MHVDDHSQSPAPGSGRRTFSPHRLDYHRSGARFRRRSRRALHPAPRATGFPLPVRGDASGESAIRLRLDAEIPHEEGYRLTVSPEGIDLTAQTPPASSAARRACCSLSIPRRSRPPVPRGPPGRCRQSSIEDHPRFGWRDLMLDIGPVFHAGPVHQAPSRPDGVLQAQRLPLASDRRPGLARRDRQVSAPDGGRRLAHRDARRPPATTRPHRYDGVRHGGFYSQDDMRAVVAYAAERHITDRPRDRHAGPHAGGHRRLSGAGQSRRAACGLAQVGDQRACPQGRRGDDPLHAGRARRGAGALSRPLRPYRRRRVPEDGVGEQRGDAGPHAGAGPFGRGPVAELFHRADGEAPAASRPPGHRLGRDP